MTPELVRTKLQKLHLNKACGPNGLHVNVMRYVQDVDIPFSLIFTKSLQTGLVPQDWRGANITPLFKEVPNNYRPVSLTSQVVKLLEKIIYDQLMDFIVSSWISCEQHVFQKKCSCVTQLLMSLRLDVSL